MVNGCKRTSTHWIPLIINGSLVRLWIHGMSSPATSETLRELPMIMQYNTSSHLRPLSTYSTRPDLGTQK